MVSFHPEAVVPAGNEVGIDGERGGDAINTTGGDINPFVGCHRPVGDVRLGDSPLRPEVGVTGEAAGTVEPTDEAVDGGRAVDDRDGQGPGGHRRVVCGGQRRSGCQVDNKIVVRGAGLVGLEGDVVVVTWWIVSACGGGGFITTGGDRNVLGELESVHIAGRGRRYDVVALEVRVVREVVAGVGVQEADQRGGCGRLIGNSDGK